ncbi:MAG: hypothetical protein HS107_06615 [Thermoflexaceae bacterium]|nr:hypothetical protein [Thermoflexaceae bacterium]
MTAKTWRTSTMLAAAAALLLLAACSDKEETIEQPTEPLPAATEAGGTPKASPTPPASATGRATPGKPSPSSTKPATSPTPGDGAIDALGPGSTDPVTLKADPSNFTGTALLEDVRTGAQKLGDRVVFEFQGTAFPPGKVEYVDSVTQCASGEPVQVKGEAILLVTFTQAAAHDDQGKATFDKLKVAGPGQVVQEVVRTCDFEGHVSWAIGVSGKKDFKISRLKDPVRIAIDVLK